MGDVADAILDGTLCQWCGVYVDGDPPGYPRTCPSCARKEATEVEPKVSNRVRCPVCKKRVKPAGLDQHVRSVHPKYFRSTYREHQ